MTSGTKSGTRARMASRMRSWSLIVMLVLAGVVASAVDVDAASLTLRWTAPTTNADGTPLNDLASYRIYLGTSSPACPSASFFTVSSPTSTPTSGQTVSTGVTALTAGTTYFARVTAVDSSGNESACSAAASGVAQPDFSVTPSTTTNFGSVATGSTADRTFTVQNTSGASISGTASIGAPYSILSGGSYSLAPGASQTVTVRFAPTAAGTFAGNVNFTASGDSISRAVSGSATGGTTFTLSVTKSGTGTGTVTSTPAGINCGASCSQSFTPGTAVTLTAAPAAGSTFAGWSGACSGTGPCAVTVNAATSVTATFTATPVTLTVTKNGTGTGTVTSSPAGINCGATCSQSVTPGTAVTLTATPAAGSTFAGWSGACSGTGTCTVTVNAATSVTATFNLLPVTAHGHQERHRLPAP